MRFRFLYRALKARFRDQRCEMKALLEVLRPGDTAVDVGANKGSYLYWLSKAVRGGRVVAFEPQPDLADYLRKACAASGLNNVRVVAAGVSDRAGTLTLHIPGDGDSPAASFEPAIEAQHACRSVEVPVHSLDDYFRDPAERVRVLKVDVEGHELAVFRGAERLLAEQSPRLVFECESRHMTSGTVLGVLDYLRARAYDGFFIQGARLLPISQFQPDVHQRTVGDRFWDAKDYCNNFILSKST